MKTQISRDSFHPEQHYSGVYLQQGRMILDADWNELTDIQKAQLVNALRDAVSGTLQAGGAIPGGAPRVGGLQIYASPDGSTNIRIQPGVLYVDGVPARLNADAPLAIDDQPEYPIQASCSGQNLMLYADVWDRSVSALEQTTLMDAALHGADTATRSQTMLQVKWCADTQDPLDPITNPPLGDATLKLKLRQIASGGDTCDPCANQVRVDERLGNYLFRVEVHDYVPTAGARLLTLKWSRDNGAEACAVASMPNGFDQGDWVWEYFDSNTERLLGNHFAPGAINLRGLIKQSCVTPTGIGEPKTWVRQWDGYIQINLDSNALLAGRDRGVALFSGDASNQAQGRVNLSGGVLKINLERMELELATGGKRFVPGDYWLAEVREAAHQSGQYVLPAMPDLAIPAQGAVPRGVRHHYLFLGKIGVNKKLESQDDAFRRRMAFPPLTDIRADDIAYGLPLCGASAANSLMERLKQLLNPDNNQSTLTVRTVLDALLCQVNAGNLPYLLPTCSGSSSVRELIGLTAADNNVGPVLDKLLCELKASSLPLNTAAPLPPVLNLPDIKTVQDALKRLAELQAGGSCAIPVGSGGQFSDLNQAFTAYSAEKDLNFCLLPGWQPVGQTTLTKRVIRLSGSGASTSVLAVSAAITLSADEIELRNLRFQLQDNSFSIVLEAKRVSAVNCVFECNGLTAGYPQPMVLVRSVGGETQLVWRDNTMATNPSGMGGASNFIWVDLALADHRIGGVIEANVLEGVLSLMHARPNALDANTPVQNPDHAVSYTPGNSLQLRGNRLGRVLSHIDWSASLLEIYATLVVADNRFTFLESSFASCALVMEGNHFAGADHSFDLAAVVLGRSGTFSGNLAVNPNALIKVCLRQVAQAANLLQLQTLNGGLCGTPSGYGYGYGYGYGCGEPLPLKAGSSWFAPAFALSVYPGAFDYFEAVEEKAIPPGLFVTSGRGGLTLAGPTDRDIIGVSLDPYDLPQESGQHVRESGLQPQELMIRSYRIPFSEQRVRTDETDGRKYLENPLGYAEDDEFMSVIEGRVYLDEATASAPVNAPARAPIGLRGRFKVCLEAGTVVKVGDYVIPGVGGKAVRSEAGRGYRVIAAGSDNGIVTILFPDESVDAEQA